MKGLTGKELEAWRPPVQRYIISDGILVPGTKMLLYGQYESWKSMLAIDLVYRVANGLPWFGFTTAKTPCYFMQTEIPQAEIRERTVKYRHNNTDSDHVWIATEPYTKLDKGAGYSELDKELGRTQAKLLIVDPMYKVISGHMTDEYDMMQLFDRMDLLMGKYGHSIILIHHPRKSQAVDGQIVTMGGDDAFGSYLQNWSDTIIRIEKTGSDVEINLTFEKVRHAIRNIESIKVRVDRNTLGFKKIG